MKKLLLTVYAVMIILTGAAFWAFFQAMRAETNVRYSSTAYIVSSKLANTIKGKGVSFIEGVKEWHHHTLNAEEYEQARKEVENV